MGDFNGDGKQDLAVANTFADTVSVRLGNGAGGFAAAPDVPVGRSPFSVAVGEFNGDPHQDLAVANSSSANVSIELGDGTGAFTAAPAVPVGLAPFGVAVADFDRNGRQDLAAVANLGTVFVRLGTGNGGFTNGPDVPASPGSQEIVIADFNRDGRPDFAVPNANSNNVTVALNSSELASSYSDLVLHDHPVGYWRFGESAGLAALDSSDRGNTGIYKGGFGVQLRQPGVLADDTAVRLDGVTGYVEVPDSPSLRMGDHFSFETWLKREYLSTSVGIEGLFGGSYMVYLDVGRLILRKPFQGVIATSKVAISDKTFHHVVVTKDGTRVHLYIDGVDVTGPVTNRTITDLPGPFAIGRGTPNPFRGTLDETAVYNYALTPAQVNAHFRAAR